MNIKCAISPRPGNWILEGSVDGDVYKPWQYFAISDRECRNNFPGARITSGTPNYETDTEAICTSFYSNLNPFEDGEVSTQFCCKKIPNLKT